MDALRIERVMLRVLLFAQPGRAAFLAIIAVIGLATAWLEPSEFRDLLSPALVGITMAAFLVMGAVRLDACCHSAGALGIPLHLEYARRTQLILLLLFVALPAIYLLAMGFGWMALSATFAAGVVGVHLFRSPLLIWLILSLWIASKMGLDAPAFAASAAGATIVAVLSVAGMAAWLRAPLRSQQQGVMDSAALADARHEVDAVPTIAPSVDQLLAGAGTDRPSPRMLWGALGHVSGFNRRWAALVALLAVAAFFAVHAYRHGRADSAYFLACSVVAGLMAGWPFFMLQGAWAITANEQSLLVLSPRWPVGRELKWLVIRTFWSQSPTWLIAWVALAVTGLLAGWIPWSVAGRGAAGFLSIAFALFGFLLVFLARRRLKKQNRLAMLYLIVTGIAGLLLIPFERSAGAWKVLCLMLLIPAALALLAFCLRRPQFPVRPDADLVL